MSSNFLHFLEDGMLFKISSKILLPLKATDRKGWFWANSNLMWKTKKGAAT